MALNRAQFQDLFHAERDRAFRFLWRLTGNAADADDLLQEAFLATWRHRRQFLGRGSAAGWLLTTAYRLFLNSRRRITRRATLAGKPEPLPAEAAGPPAHEGNGAGTNGLERREATEFLLARVHEALTRVPEEPREAFLMFRYAGLRVQEIAEMTGAPPKTVETRIRRATILLAEALGDLREHLPT